MTSIKKLLGIAEEYEHFDADIIIHINAVLDTLRQMGIGPPEGFMIKDNTAVWTDFVPDDYPELHLLKTFVYLKVKLIFDSSTFGSPYIEALNNMLKEIEWRLYVSAEAQQGDITT